MQLLRQLLFKCDTNIEVMVFSYSITDGWMRQLQKLRREYDIVYVTLVLDRDVMIRHREKLVQLQCVAEAVYLTDSHAKLYYVKSDNYQAVTITSANATNNYRNECYYATERPSDIEIITGDIRSILETSSRIV